MIPVESVEQCWGVTHSHFSFPVLSSALTVLYTLLTSSPSQHPCPRPPFPPFATSLTYHPTLSPSLPCFLPLPFLQNISLKYEIIDEFHDELWHLGAEMRLMSGNYQDAELTNGHLPSFVSSWSCCIPPPAGRGVGMWEQWEWAAYELLRSIPQVRMSNVFCKSVAFSHWEKTSLKMTGSWVNSTSDNKIVVHTIVIETTDMIYAKAWHHY